MNTKVTLISVLAPTTKGLIEVQVNRHFDSVKDMIKSYRLQHCKYNVDINGEIEHWSYYNKFLNY